MTFSIAGLCRRTGMLGAAITTSSIAVGSRCPWARAGVGVVLTQNLTDPRLAPQGLDLLEQGLDAGSVVERVVAGAENVAHRQLAVIDREGRTAHYTGAKAIGNQALLDLELGIVCERCHHFQAVVLPLGPIGHFLGLRRTV